MVKLNDFVLPSVVVVLLVAGVLVFFPGLIGSIGAIFSGQVNFCDDAPYDSECVCVEGDRKVPVPWLGIPRWSCETLEELLIDPDSPTFESDALQFTEDYLTRFCGFEGANICTDISCGEPCVGTGPVFPINRCKQPSYGWSTQGARLVNVECIEITEWSTPQGEMTHEEALAVFGNEPNANIRESSGKLPWRMSFFVESPTGTPTTLELFAWANYCLNPEQTISCTSALHCQQREDIGQGGDWCVPELPMNFIPNDSPFSVVGIGSGLGSGFPSPVPR